MPITTVTVKKHPRDPDPPGLEHIVNVRETMVHVSFKSEKKVPMADSEDYEIHTYTFPPGDCYLEPDIMRRLRAEKGNDSTFAKSLRPKGSEKAEEAIESMNAEREAARRAQRQGERRD